MAPNPHSRPVILYRWLVFALAAFYSVYMLTTSSYEGAGGPFRYLTIWALLLSFFCASRVLAISERRSDRRWDAVIAATAVVNAMVVFLYWRLYFADAASVTRNGELGVWWKEYYLHGAGAVLMWIDAIVINRPFRRLVASALTLVGIVVAYVAWSELLVGPLNGTPIGSVTTGLPYPFLNNLELAGRLEFYGVNVVTALVVLAVFFALGWVMRRVFGDRPDIAAGTDKAVRA
ncbi:MAG: hypothetical protein AAFO93_15900 [Pseudomonadota bacterium]